MTSTPTITPSTMNQSPSAPVVNTNNASTQPVPPEQAQQDQRRADGGEVKETFKEKISRLSNNCLRSTGLCCFTAKEQSQIAALEFQISQRQKKFGVDYLTMLLADQQQQQQQEQLQNSNGDAAPPPPQDPIAEALERCVQEAVEDIRALQSEIDSHNVTIDQRTVEVQSQLQPAPGAPSSQPTTGGAAVVVAPDEGVEATPEKNNDNNNEPSSPSTPSSNTPAPPAPSSETTNTNTATEAPPADSTTTSSTPVTQPPAAAAAAAASETTKEPSEKPVEC